MEKKRKPKTAKAKAWDEFSRYIRLRDAKHGSYPDRWGPCCCCGKPVFWNRGDAGHFIGRGIGGGSGVYFDERNVHLQCKRCNGFKQGNYPGYEKFMLKNYGQEVIDELKRKDKVPVRIHSWQYKIMEDYYRSLADALEKGVVANV
jgi:hypothetical protein